MRENRSLESRVIFGPKQRKGFISLAVIAALFLSAPACTYTRLYRQLSSVSEFGHLDKNSPFLKVHMLDGRVYVLSQWQESGMDRQVSGTGELLDLNRDLIQKGEFTIPLDDVAIFETNIIKGSPVTTGMSVVTGVSLGFTIYCLANPKACFGSCPTFYAWDGKSMTLQAEGFSASVAPSLEAGDVDALYQARPSSSLMEIQVTNEALETHLIRYANVLAAPKPENGRVFITPGGEFWQASALLEPTSCRGSEGSFLEKVRSLDGLERWSESDSENLAAKETIDLAFQAEPGRDFGLVLGFRQTLLTTYLFYQGLAYLGDTTGYWLAQLERGDEKARAISGGPGQFLGGIDISVRVQHQKWVQVGTVRETGPIATNIQVFPLPRTGSGPIEARLRLTKGLWRLDYIALANLEKKVEPVRISPVAIVRQKASEFSSEKGQPGPESAWPIVTMPGDVYSLKYELPSDFANYELFLETQGYYLEWMRQAWLNEKDLRKARLMFTNPAKFLRMMAPQFKKIEPQMEETFWRSRYGKITSN